MKDPNTGVFINLLTDFGFKFLFGNGEETEFLLSLLNAVFNNEPRIEKIIKIDKELPGENAEDRTTIYDVHCKTEKGDVFCLDMRFSVSYYENDFKWNSP